MITHRAQARCYALGYFSASDGAALHYNIGMQRAVSFYVLCFAFQALHAAIAEMAGRCTPPAPSPLASIPVILATALGDI